MDLDLCSNIQLESPLTSRTTEPLAPEQCWAVLNDAAQSSCLLLESRHSTTPSRPVRIVDTHGHAHLNRESQTEYEASQNGQIRQAVGGIRGTEVTLSVSTALGQPHIPQHYNSSLVGVVSLTCAVEPADWNTCLAYAAQSPDRRAAIGVHPWYIAAVIDNVDKSSLEQTHHYPNSWLQELERLLQEHPGCMVGEIGLCKMARFLRTYSGGKDQATALQRDVFIQQLCLAARYQRPVSVHCVNQQGVLLEVLKQQTDDGLLPPTIALHSFTGTAHQIEQLLQWEKSLNRRKPLLYFGFSHTINYVMCTSEKSRRQGVLAVQKVPRDRLLTESDVHCDENVALGTAGSIAYIAWALGMPIVDVADLTQRNGLEFLQSLPSGE